MTEPPNLITISLTDEQVDSIIEQATARVLARLAKESPRTPSAYLTVPEAAEYLRCGQQRIYNLTSEGRLTRHKDGSRVLVARAEVDAYLRGEPVGPLAERTAGAARCLSTRTSVGGKLA